MVNRGSSRASFSINSSQADPLGDQIDRFINDEAMSLWVRTVPSASQNVWDLTFEDFTRTFLRDDLLRVTGVLCVVYVHNI